MNLYTEYSPSEINIFKSLSSNTVSLANSTFLEISNNIYILDQIPKNILNKIITDIKIKKYQQNEIIVKENNIANDIFFILKGTVSLKNSNKKSLTSNNLFGEVDSLLQQKRKESIISLQKDTTILSFKINFNLFKSDLSYYFAIIFKNLSEELKNRISSIENKENKNAN
jgi:signal-transduction protein with cAMP-binding, CBS, and nucleotidyltransferase domain